MLPPPRRFTDVTDGAAVAQQQHTGPAERKKRAVQLDSKTSKAAYIADRAGDVLPDDIVRRGGVMGILKRAKKGSSERMGWGERTLSYESKT